MTAVVPDTEQAMSEIVIDAARQGRQLSICGGGSRADGAESPGTTLSASGLSGITLYEPGALTIVARAGTPVADIEATLAAEGQHLAFEPHDARNLTGNNGTPTIGGMVATNASGPRRIQAGACRDSMIGVRFIDGTGAVVKNGGRVMKNVTGLDLVRLMAGSRGTLGILTEAAFKVLPKPRCSVTVMFDGLDVFSAVDAMTSAMATPFDVTGAAHVPGKRTMLRVEGFAASAESRAQKLARALSRFGAAELSEDENWQDIRNVTAFSDLPGDVWRISARPTDGPGVISALPGIPSYLDLAGGLIWALAPSGYDVRKALNGIRGHATLVRAAAETHRCFGTFEPEPDPVARLSAGLRAKFDPAGIFNPGRMDAPATIAGQTD